MGEATWPAARGLQGQGNFNPRFPWGKRLFKTAENRESPHISIHASRGGSDGFRAAPAGACVYFNPHFPWGKRLFQLFSRFKRRKFQSTLPVGEATIGPPPKVKKMKDFNPRFPWGKRPQSSCWPSRPAPFQSTLPVGEATSVGVAAVDSKAISIHASRGGSDIIFHTHFL